MFHKSFLCYSANSLALTSTYFRQKSTVAKRITLHRPRNYFRLYFVEQWLRRNESHLKLVDADEIRYENVDLTHLAQKMNQRCPLMNSDETMGSIKLENFLTSWAIISFSRSTTTTTTIAITTTAAAAAPTYDANYFRSSTSTTSYVSHDSSSSF